MKQIFKIYYEVEESKLYGHALSLLPFVQKMEAGGQTLHMLVSACYLWKNMLEIGSRVPLGIGAQEWEKGLPFVTFTIFSSRITCYVFKTNTKASLLSSSHSTRLYVKTSMKINVW